MTSGFEDQAPVNREHTMRALVGEMLAGEQAARGADFRPNDWAMSVSPVEEADAMLVACWFGVRLHISSHIPRGVVLLRELPPEVR